MEYNLIGKTLGDRYEILELIGSGGMASVYKAKCHLLNRYVAVKILKSSLLNDEEVVKKFSTESRAAASLSHHNIVSVYDVGETDGLNYIVMEYVDGVTLKEYIKQRQYLDWREACKFAIQIAMALACAHDHGIIHRDIKPHNILLTKDHTLKVADFGIARTIGSDTVIQSSKSGVLGSVHYISPEQARGGYIDARSDVYSLGVVLYEMLTGKLPFDGENPVSVALMKLESTPDDVRDINPDIPDEVAEIVNKAIARERDNRYQSAMDLAVGLREVLDDLSTGGTNMKHTKRSKSKAKKSVHAINGKMVLGGVVLAILLGVGSYLFFSGGTKEYPVPDLMDKTLEEAIALANESGFKIDEENITYLVSDEFEEGNIMKQTPGANVYAKKHKAIEVVISSGSSEGNIEVPDVTGLDYAKAAAQLRAAKLKYRKIEELSADHEFNEVISQSPKTGTKVSEGYVVLLHVCSGAPESSASADTQTVTVPKLMGTTLDNADVLLKNANLKRGNVSKEDSDSPEGTIISQSPKSGSESPKDSYVNLVISSGKQASEPTQTVAPTQKPQATTAPEPELKKKTLTITLPQREGTVQVKVVANGSTIHDAQHQCSEGEVDITVKGKNDATVEVYFDGVLQTTKVIEF